MTTIATDGLCMAADSALGGECLHGTIRKLNRAKDGAILGSCGQAFDFAGFLAWYDAGGTGEPNVTDDFEGLILKPDGTVLCVDAKGRAFEHSKPAAIGSGCRFAYGAMDAGSSPFEAVAIAIRRDGFSAEPVEVMRLGAVE